MRGMNVLKIGVGRTGFGAMSFCLALGFALRVEGLDWHLRSQSQ